ncbi:hypothetical protein [Gaoshiqia sp. Z1-71]|uniref:hypothetical protein n=1 Tax=Gaoshiqia hydrogeniformans TaxID=3290090 RepID=UPI003BF8D0CE
MNLKTITLAFLFLIFMLACRKDDAKNDATSIVKMSFDFGEVIFDGNEGAINAPENTDLKKLVPIIELSEGAVVYPPSETITDFTTPVEYTVTSEDGKNVAHYTVSVYLPVVKFTVFDCTNRSAEHPTAELAPGANISIYYDRSGQKELLEKLITDEKGEALLYANRDLIYYFRTDKNGAVDIIDGYVIYGIFESQAEIDNSPLQLQPSQIGDLRFLDTNADGVVNADDRSDYQNIRDIPEQGLCEIKVYIARE